MNVTDISTLGVDYTVVDRSGKPVRTIKVIDHDEILNATAGIYTSAHGTYTEYLEKCATKLSGTENIDFTRIMWSVTSDPDMQISNVIKFAVKNGYSVIVLEVVDDE